MILDYINDALGEGTPHRTRKGMQYSYDCPFCDDNRERLFINVDRQVFWCHNCESTGSLITFISDYTHIPWRDALDVYRNHEGYERQLPEDLEQEIYSKLMGSLSAPLEKYHYPLPEEFIPLWEAKGNAGYNALKYFLSRGLTVDDAERYFIGYCAEGQYANRIIMPDFEDGELIYWQARTWEPKSKNKHLAKFYRKVLNPSLTEEQLSSGVQAIDKSEIISNIDLVVENGVAIICEGRFDSYTLGDSGACIHGKHMSDAQFIKLVQNKDKIQSVLVMLDGDAFSYAVNTAKRLYAHYDDVLVCKLPDDQDPNQLGRDRCLGILSEAIPYTPMFEVKARLKGWM